MFHQKLCNMYLYIDLSGNNYVFSHDSPESYGLCQDPINVAVVVRRDVNSLRTDFTCLDCH